MEHIIIYGYTKAGNIDYYGKETKTSLFRTKEKRNRNMYQDYSETFDNAVYESPYENMDWDRTKKQTEKEFLDMIENVKNAEHDVFGIIQGPDWHIQFEPFCIEL